MTRIFYFFLSKIPAGEKKETVNLTIYGLFCVVDDILVVHVPTLVVGISPTFGSFLPEKVVVYWFSCFCFLNLLCL